MSLHHSPDKKYLIQLENYDTTKIVFGEGAFGQLGAELMLDNCSIAAFIFGGRASTLHNGVYHDYMLMNSSFDLEVSAFSDVPPEPDVETVRNIVKFLEDAKPERVIAVGGGSVMDAAKAAYLSWQTGMDVTELFGFNKASSKFSDRTFKKVVCIPTTAGTGSETTPYANIVDKEKNVKCLIMDEAITPELAFVDSAFASAMPQELTVTTAMDAMVHAIESFLNTKTACEYPQTADDRALEAVRLIHYALPEVIKNPQNRLGREMLSAAATLGGISIRTRPTSLPHLCSFSLFGQMPHGNAVAYFLPVFWRYYLTEPAVQEKTMRLAEIFGSNLQTPEAVVNAVEQFIYTFLLKPAFTKEQITAIAKDAVKNPVKLESAPRSITPDDAEKVIGDILTKAFMA